MDSLAWQDRLRKIVDSRESPERARRWREGGLALLVAILIAGAGIGGMALGGHLMREPGLEPPFVPVGEEEGLAASQADPAFDATEPPLPTIDPGTPIEALMPSAPDRTPAPVYLGDDLARVPTVRYESAPGGETSRRAWQERRGRDVASALHLNAKEEDGYLKALLGRREDLRGLPFVMGGACRTKGDRAIAFKAAVSDTPRILVHFLKGDTEGGHPIPKAGTALDSLQELYLQGQIAAVRQTLSPFDGARGDAAVQ